MWTTPTASRFIIVIIDYFTEWCEFALILNEEASVVAVVYVDEWVARYGVSSVLDSHRGAAIKGRLSLEVCRELGIQKTETTL